MQYDVNQPSFIHESRPDTLLNIRYVTHQETI